MQSRSLRLTLSLLALAGLALAGTEMALFLAGPAAPAWLFLSFAAVGLLYVAAGVLAWRRRPSNRTGALLCLCGLSLLAAAAGNTGVPALMVVGYVTAELPVAVLLHLLLAFPSGRLPDLPSRALAIAGYVISVALHAPSYLFAPDPGWPAVLLVADRPELVAAVEVVQKLAGAVVIALSAWVLIRRLQRFGRGQRWALASVYAYGAFTIVFLTFSANVIAPVLELDPVQLFMLQLAAVAGVPFAFVAGVLRGGFARTGELEELGVWLGLADSDRPGLRQALGATLGDPSLQLLFWLPDAGGYIDATGRDVPLPVPGSGRGAVQVELAEGRVGAILYDASLIADPELVRAGGRVIALALERERLTAQLMASRESLRDSRARLVESGDVERRRLARDLHDGVQGRLVLLALQAGRLAADPTAATTRSQATEIRAGLETAIAELRRLVHGVMPALLIERGLSAATEELVDGTPIPTMLELRCSGALPPPVESAGYFVVAEALTNAVKYSRAHQLTVRLSRSDHHLVVEVCDDGVGGASEDGPGLRGLNDRVESLGGRLLLHSPPGGGTRIMAELPCGS